MHPLGRNILILFLLATAGVAVCEVQAAELTLEWHPWGRFKPGAWKLYRVVTETFNNQGTVIETSVTYTKASLKSAEVRLGVTLSMEAIVEMAGRRLASEPRTVQQGLHGEVPAERVVVRDLGKAEVTIGGQKVACSVEEQEMLGASGRTTIKTYFSPSVSPFVLRRETRTLSPDQGSVSETVLDVTALKVTCDLFPQLTNAAKVTVISTNPKGRTVTKAITSIDVPGGVVCHTAEEMDAEGHLVRRSTLTVIDYDSEPKREHPAFFSRIRTRGHKPHRYTPPDSPDRSK